MIKSILIILGIFISICPMESNHVDLNSNLLNTIDNLPDPRLPKQGKVKYSRLQRLLGFGRKARKKEKLALKQQKAFVQRQNAFIQKINNSNVAYSKDLRNQAAAKLPVGSARNNFFAENRRQKYAAKKGPLMVGRYGIPIQKSKQGPYHLANIQRAQQIKAQQIKAHQANKKLGKIPTPSHPKSQYGPAPKIPAPNNPKSQYGPAPKFQAGNQAPKPNAAPRYKPISVPPVPPRASAPGPAKPPRAHAAPPTNTPTNYPRTNAPPAKPPRPDAATKTVQQKMLQQQLKEKQAKMNAAKQNATKKNTAKRKSRGPR